MINRDTFTSSQPGCLLVHFLALIFLAETSRTVLKRNGCLHFMYFYSTSILPKTQEEQNPYKILEQNPARFFFLSWWFLPTFLVSSSFFFFFSFLSQAGSGGWQARPHLTYLAFSVLVHLHDVSVDSVTKWELDDGITASGFAARRAVSAASTAAEGRDLCCDSTLGGAARECATLTTTALVVTKAPWQCVNKGHVKSHKGQCVGL